jgi:hypothetical protein
MAKTPTAVPPETQPAADVPLSEERLKQAWDRYGTAVYFVCALVALAILAKGGWQYLKAQKEQGIQKEFADCTTMETYQTFAASHAGHPLAGVAEVIIADNDYSSGRFADAVGAYRSAVADLPAGPVRDRARLGLAMALELSGKAADAEASLRQLINDTSLLKAVRAEACYHLATAELAAGRGAEVQRIAEQALSIDPTSPYAERAFSLRPKSAAPAAPGAIALPAAP